MIVYSPGNSGKTVSYLIGCLQIIDQQLSACQVIIISPTREVALIIYKLFLELNEHLNIKGRLIIRGNNVR
jgi:translation initiation factor 4A